MGFIVWFLISMLPGLITFNLMRHTYHYEKKSYHMTREISTRYQFPLWTYLLLCIFSTFCMGSITILIYGVWFSEHCRNWNDFQVKLHNVTWFGIEKPFKLIWNFLNKKI